MLELKLEEVMELQNKTFDDLFNAHDAFIKNLPLNIDAEQFAGIVITLNTQCDYLNKMCLSQLETKAALETCTWQINRLVKQFDIQRSSIFIPCDENTEAKQDQQEKLSKVNQIEIQKLLAHRVDLVVKIATYQNHLNNISKQLEGRSTNNLTTIPDSTTDETKHTDIAITDVSNKIDSLENNMTSLSPTKEPPPPPPPPPKNNSLLNPKNAAETKALSSLPPNKTNVNGTNNKEILAAIIASQVTGRTETEEEKKSRLKALERLSTKPPQEIKQRDYRGSLKIKPTKSNNNDASELNSSTNLFNSVNTQEKLLKDEGTTNLPNNQK